MRTLARMLYRTAYLAITLSIAAALATIVPGAGDSARLAADEAAAGANAGANAGAAAPVAGADANSGAAASAGANGAPLAPLANRPDEGGVALTKPASSVDGNAGASVAGADDDDTQAADMVAELRRRRADADAREKALDARETELKAREVAVEDELKKLQSIRDDIAAVEDSRKKENDSRVAKIVETVETMSPKAAAPLLATMDESLAVAAMGKIATPKLAKIMNNMEPRKSARLSELLAGVVRARNAEPLARAPAHVASNGAAEATEKSARGGEQDDGHSQ